MLGGLGLELAAGAEDIDDAADALGLSSGSTAGKSPAVSGGTMFVTTTIKDTGERKQMFGYTARHIIQTIETDSSPDACSKSKTKMEMDMWVIDAEFGLSCPATRQYRPAGNSNTGGCRDRVQQKTIGTAKSGYPVYQKMTTFDANGKVSYTMVQEVVELSKATLDASLFEAPAGYREVKDMSEMYAAAPTPDLDSGSGTANTNPSLPASNGLGSTISKAAAPQAVNGQSNGLGPKQPGTIRLGLAPVKTGAVGEGISAADLAAAVRNTLGEYLKGTRIEVVQLEARLASAQAGEAKEKLCDFVVFADVSHKKGGGGGFGLGKMLSAAAPIIPMAGGVPGIVAGQVISTAITASSLAGNVKKKDEITLDLKLQSPDVLHKSDKGLLHLNVTPADAGAVAADLLAAGGANANGVLVQEQLESGLELLVAVRSEIRGLPPLLTVGYGGVQAEIWGDVATHPLPVSRGDVETLLRALRCGRLLTGYRGDPGYDVPAAIDTILAIVRAAALLGDRLLELEVNPVIVQRPGGGAHAADALIHLRPAGDS